MPWLPRPKWWQRPPSATLLLATWNLELFSVGAADTSTVAKKVSHICETLRTLCSREGPDASVVVALQEVFCDAAVPFLAAYLTEKDAAAGGSGRVWHGVTSERLGKNPERAAFLWAGPPARQQGQRRRKPQAPLHADAASGFQLLSKEDFDTQRDGEGTSGFFIRSPYYGLFRVGYANLLLVNVHLAAQAEAARSELSALHSLAAAIQQPNCRLLRRHSLGGRLRGRKPRGLVAIVGDFNCPLSRRALAVGGTTTPPSARDSPRPVAARSAAAAAAACGTGGAGTGTAGGLGGSGPLGEGRETQQQRQQQQQPLQQKTATAIPKINGQANGNGRGGGYGQAGANGPSWEAFLRNGWVNALHTDNSNDATPNGGIGNSSDSKFNGSGNGREEHGGGLPLATNWRAKQLKALDAICLPLVHESLVTGQGVCAPPAHVDASQPGQYPNHLLCWVRLDLGPLQMAPGKVRELMAPARLSVPVATAGTAAAPARAG